MKIVAFLPAKGTSERIENKNLKIIDGKPLFLHTLEKLSECNFIDEVYLDTESSELFDIASEIKYKPLLRDPSLATNKTDGNALFWNEVKQVDADIYIQILCTSPFIEKDTIKRGINILVDNSSYDSVVLVKKDKLYTWKNGKPEYNIDKIPNSKDLNETIIETMGLYIVRKETAFNLKKRIGNAPYLLEAKPIESIDINYADDFNLANIIFSGLKENEIRKMTNLKWLLTSEVLSDVMDEFGLNCVLKNYHLNIKNKKILGRAKTIEIKKVHNNDNPGDIYNALKSYDYIVKNDVIVVKTELDEFAYFGELNAQLSIRNGASAAIISGYTRDLRQVENLDFPVFAKGYTCQDVKNRGILKSINKRVEIDNIEIKPNDLIFGDLNGIVIIPNSFENQVIDAALLKITREKRIVIDIIEGINAYDIYLKHGGF